MIYRHNRTGLLYRVLMEAFDVARQRSVLIYVSLDSGQVFTRDRDKFGENFTFYSHPQASIVPKEPHE